MRFTLLISLLIFIVSPSMAQFDDEGDFANKYRAIFLNFGPRVLDTDPGTIHTYYVDDSPSQDEFESTTIIEDEYKKYGFQVGYKWGRYRGLSHSLLFDISMGKHQGGLFTYSLGYNFPVKIASTALVIRGAAYGGFGNYGFNLGKINNEAGYIQINEQIYTQDYLNVRLTSQAFVYGPQVDLMLMITDHFEVLASFNYNLQSGNSRPKIEFSADSDDEVPNSSLPINGDNPNVSYNGDKLSSLPYDISGFRMSFGVAYVWNYY